MSEINFRYNLIYNYFSYLSYHDRSGLPFLCSYLSSVVFCYIADWLLKYELLSLTNVRKVMTASSQVIPGLLVVLVGYLDSELIWILIIWSVAVMLVCVIINLHHMEAVTHATLYLDRSQPVTQVLWQTLSISHQTLLVQC